MKYVKLLKEISTQNKYSKIYEKLCLRAFERCKTKKEAKKHLEYFESHHIYPQCFNKNYAKEKENLVFLTAKEHYIAHLLLVRMFSGKKKSQMAYALLQFGRKRTGVYSLNSNQFAMIRRIMSETKTGMKREKFSDEWIEKLRQRAKERYESGQSSLGDQKGEHNGMFGKKHSEETKRIFREQRKGKYAGPENPMFGRTHSKETVDFIKKNNTGRIWINNGIANKYIFPDGAKEFLENDWKRGRKMDKRAIKKYLKKTLDIRM